MISSAYAPRHGRRSADHRLRASLVLIGLSFGASCGPASTVERVALPPVAGGTASQPPVVIPETDPRPGASGAGARDAAGGGSVGGVDEPRGQLDGGAGGSSQPVADAGRPRPADSSAPVDAAVLPDAAGLPDSAPVSAPPGDAAPPQPPPSDAAFGAGCGPLPAAADRISDFEDGSLTTLRVGNRGGTPWTVVGQGAGSGTLAPAEIPAMCGSRRALLFSGTSSADQRPIARATLVEAGPAPRFFDASRYRGVLLHVRGVTPGRVRVKVSDRNTTAGGGVCVVCNNHFQLDFDVGTQFVTYVLPFANMRQAGAEEQQPAVAANALFAIEIVPLNAGAFELVIDDLNFIL